jgi:hypothetical protein
MKIGNKEIPNMRLNALLGEVKTLYEKIGLNEVEAGVAAEFLQHKSAASGAFLTKLAAMRDYGLLEGRGKVQVSSIGQRLSEPKTDEGTRAQAMLDAATKVPLWKTIYEKYTKKGLDVPEADFWNDIRESCALTIDEAKKAAPSVLQAFKEDFKFLRTSQIITPSMNQNIQTNPSLNRPPSNEGMLPIGFGDVKAYLPKDKPEEAWARLKRMVDAYLGVAEEKPKK